MKVSEVIIILQQFDPNYEVAIEQIFKDAGRSIQLRSIEVINKCVVFKDHYTRVSQYNTFISFDGKEFAVPPISERYMKHELR